MSPPGGENLELMVATLFVVANKVVKSPVVRNMAKEGGGRIGVT